jgi:hypothetical protein
MIGLDGQDEVEEEMELAGTKDDEGPYEIGSIRLILFLKNMRHETMIWTNAECVCLLITAVRHRQLDGDRMVTRSVLCVGCCGELEDVGRNRTIARSQLGES